MWWHGGTQESRLQSRLELSFKTCCFLQDLLLVSRALLLASKAPTHRAHLQRVQEAVKEEAAKEEEKEEIKAEVAKEVKEKMEEVQPSLDLIAKLSYWLLFYECQPACLCVRSVPTCCIAPVSHLCPCVCVSVCTRLSASTSTRRETGAAGTCANTLAHTRTRLARPHDHSRTCAHAHMQVAAGAQGPTAPAPPPAEPAPPPAAPPAAAKCIDCQGLEGFGEEEGCGPLCKLERLVGQLQNHGD